MFALTLAVVNEKIENPISSHHETYLLSLGEKLAWVRTPDIERQIPG